MRNIWGSGRLVKPYHPWRLALAAASLDQLSDGRLMLGVGLGVGSDFGRFGDDASTAERARRYDEALEVLQLLWTGQPVTFVGEFFRLDDVTLWSCLARSLGSRRWSRAGGRTSGPSVALVVGTE